MALHEFRWSAFGTIGVEADTPEEAEQEANDALFSFDMLMVEDYSVDGVELIEGGDEDTPTILHLKDNPLISHEGKDTWNG